MVRISFHSFVSSFSDNSQHYKCDKTVQKYTGDRFKGIYVWMAGAQWHPYSFQYNIWIGLCVEYLQNISTISKACWSANNPPVYA